MAVPDSVRRGGSLLLRTLAVGGVATVAWLLGHGVAGASEEDGATTRETVLQVMEQQHAANVTLLTGLVENKAPAQSTSTAGTASTTKDDRQSEADYSGSTTSTTPTTLTGSVSNTVPTPTPAAPPAPVVEQHEAPPPPPETAPVVEAPPTPPGYAWTPPTETEPLPEAAPEPSPVQVVDVTWHKPEAPAPAPAPKQSPGTPTCGTSAGAQDTSNSHRAGVSAVVANQFPLRPVPSWRVERREDWPSAGRTQGLPSASPD
ncbi:hypothetical protein GCM10022243_63470 [Saccharothrix violaceirubra]|uniref:Uncharacterized protein n=1 Tax=Saccharothrix violaceirubra TaxID=413306 RepID=A0A7W7SXB9_9PSEU|nr:hypothetical protein [Saccharothrix violaceirubra]MBB4962707.1 hypothetical protein [Saccharothrix violaceirubra]